MRVNRFEMAFWAVALFAALFSGLWVMLDIAMRNLNSPWWTLAAVFFYTTPVAFIAWVGTQMKGRLDA